jgi:hypothetical protein
MVQQAGGGRNATGGGVCGRRGASVTGGGVRGERGATGGCAGARRAVVWNLVGHGSKWVCPRISVIRR